jgi:hypothetical protein
MRIVNIIVSVPWICWTNRAKVQLLIGGKDALRDTHKIIGRLRSLLANVTTTIVPEGGHALLNTTTYILPFLNKTTLLA